MAFSQPELFLHEILHLRQPLVGSLAYFLFGTEQGGPVEKRHPIDMSKNVDFIFVLIAY